jgi:uncharacterized membrane protein/protein-disulfide isomerase
MKWIRILSLIAVLVTGYITWTSYTGSHLVGCGEQNSGCEEVTHTRWSTWFHLPVSVGGLLVYGAIFGVSMTMSAGSSQTRWRLLLFLAITAAASAIWFASLQLFVIHSICKFCMSVHACGIIIAILTLRAIPRRESVHPKDAKRRNDLVNRSQRMEAIALAFVVVAILVVGQVWPSKTAQLQTATDTPAPAAAIPPKQHANIPHREIDLANGAMKLNLGDYPILGSTRAQRTLAVFLDYTCPACRSFHPMLADVVRKNIDGLAVIVLPMPLDAECNHNIQQTAYTHQDACLYWKIALAVWNINPNAFGQFDAFMFGSEFPPSLQDARTVADRLVGKQAMDAELADPHLSDQVQFGIAMFDQPYVKNKALPTLVTEQTSFTGSEAATALSSFQK